MKRSRYYRPARPPVLTYVLTGIAAVVVFGSMLYLKMYHSPGERLLSANRYPPDYPPVPSIKLFDADNRPYRIGAQMCGAVLLAPLEQACTGRIEAHRKIYQAMRTQLQQYQTTAAPLYLIDPSPYASEDKRANPGTIAVACADDAGGDRAVVLRGSWRSVALLYQHFNLMHGISTATASVCAQEDIAPWILLDARGTPLLYFHTLERAPVLAREYLRVLTEKPVRSADTPER